MRALGDREGMLDLLLTEKYLADLYNRAEAECSNHDLREELHSLHSSHEAQHARLFREVQRRGWYQPPAASPELVQHLLRTWEERTRHDPALAPGPARAGR